MNLKYYLRGLGIGILVTAIIMLVISYQNKQTLTDNEIKQRAKELGMVDESESLTKLVGEATSTPVVVELLEPSPSSDVDINNDELNNDDETSLEATPSKEPQVEADNESEADLEQIENLLDEADEYLENKTDKKPTSKPTDTPKPTKEPTVKPTEKPTETPKPTKEPEPTKAVEPSKEPKPTVEPTKKPANESKTVTLVISSGESSYTVAKHLASLGVVENANEFDNYLCETGIDRKIRTGSFEIEIGSTKEEIAKKIGG